MLRRALLVASDDASLAVAVDAAVSLAPGLESLLAVVAAGEHDDRAVARSLAAVPAGCRTEVVVASRRLSATLDDLPAAHLPDLVVVGPEADGVDVALLSAALGFADHHQRPLLLPAVASSTRAHHVVALTDGKLTGAPAAARFAHLALSEVQDVGVLVVGDPRTEAAHASLSELANLAGLTVPVDELWAGGWSDALQLVLERRGAGRASLVLVPAALARVVPFLMASWGLAQASQRLTLPLLVLPAPPLLGHPDLAASDALVIDGRASLALALEGLVERSRPEPGTRASCRFPSGRVESRQVDAAGALAFEALEPTDNLVSLSVEGAREPVAVRLVAPGPLPFGLFDVALLETDVPGAFVRRLANDTTRSWCAVRMRHEFAIDRARQLLSDRALSTVPLLDASALLADGGADDVPSRVDGVRLVRVATCLRLRGCPVATVAVPTPVAALDGVEVVTVDEVHDLPSFVRPRPATALDERLDRVTGSALVHGNTVEWRLDNRHAREELLDRIDAARTSVSIQTYMAADDEVGRALEHVLVRAAARGVRVRVLADALYSLHEALGRQNPLLARLAWAPGVELRAIEPLSGLPTVDGLKRRAHRKLVVVDGAWATVSGRNLADEYYRGFDEVVLTPETDWREVPWLDAAAALQGPLVAKVAQAFEAEWLEAGGVPGAPVEAVKPVGGAPSRLLLHDGARDARILDAALELVGSARHRIVIANAFPLALELQFALLQALRRGVSMRVLAGRVRPRYAPREPGQVESPFAGGAIRDLGDQLVLARLDPLAAAGADVRLFRLRAVPGWDTRLGDVFPYVHSKVMTVDGTHALVGSANLDVTASYWEGEASVLVEDPAAVGALDAALDAILDGSIPLSELEPVDAPRQRFRAWLAEHWPNMLG